MGIILLLVWDYRIDFGCLLRRDYKRQTGSLLEGDYKRGSMEGMKGLAVFS
jgi:hypothetical protein